MKIDNTKIKRLEIITMKLEKIKEPNIVVIVVEDLRWLVKELREAWLREEKDDD